MEKLIINERFKEKDGKYESHFHYIISKNVNRITKLTKDEDEDVYTKIVIRHENIIDMELFHMSTMRYDLAFKLCGLDMMKRQELDDIQSSNVLDVFTNIIPITKEQYEENKKSNING